VSGALLGPVTNFVFLLEISFRQLRLCYFVAPSLTRGRICNLLLQLLLGLATAVTLGSNHGHILLPHLRLPQPGGPGSRIYIPQEQGGSVIPPGTGFPFCRLLTTCRDYGGGILTRLHTGKFSHSSNPNIIIQLINRTGYSTRFPVFLSARYFTRSDRSSVLIASALKLFLLKCKHI
jgi:hypothetical protein